MNEIIILLSVGLLAGILSGMIGVGGGIIIVPALVFFMKMDQLQAQGTSLAVLLLPVGILAVMNYYKGGYIDMRAAMLISITFVLGGFIGSRVSIGLEQDTVKKIFGAAMILISLKMIFGK